MVKPIDVYINNLKRLTDTKTDTALAEAIGLAKQTIANWRRRGMVPAKQQFRLIDSFGSEAAFDPDVGYTFSLREQRILLSVFLQIYDKYQSRFGPKKESDRYAAWANLYRNLEHHFGIVLHVNGLIQLSNETNLAEYDSSAISQYVTSLIEAGGIEDFLKTAFNDHKKQVDQ